MKGEKMKLKKIHKQRLLKLAKFLRTKVAQRKAECRSGCNVGLFDMFQWLQPDKKGHAHPSRKFVVRHTGLRCRMGDGYFS